MGPSGIGHICAAYRKDNKALPHLTAMIASAANESVHCSNCRCDYALTENNYGVWQNAREVITSNALPRKEVTRLTAKLATMGRDSQSSVDAGTTRNVR